MACWRLCAACFELDRTRSLDLLDTLHDSLITHQPRSELPHLSLSIMPGTVGRPSWLKTNFARTAG
ncbi:hypothetical protein BDV38DRAFT_284273 [Aspergillus pseudotamarii]|uniref:Uncharacterized protein n=1 Tax=Aspergillus pseudotamarii TaxID=132259 RepID=A0A5N6SQL0_ASPPS|nr:uncharacterized protein BDV38DRAFT_284273 [Aspergillus pseudotamarii]KAE8136031.1 hypothetical protein BDV38DRAFT_284273 [Aspergillus pseudotamarii]